MKYYYVIPQFVHLRTTNPVILRSQCSQLPRGPAGPHGATAKSLGQDGTATTRPFGVVKCRPAVLGLEGGPNRVTMCVEGRGGGRLGTVEDSRG